MASMHAVSALPRAPLNMSPLPVTQPTIGPFAASAAADTSRTATPVAGAGGTSTVASAAGALPPTWTDAQGRVFQQAIDSRGHLVRIHHDTAAQGADQLATDIAYDFSPDGTAARTVRQRLTAVSGDYRDVSEVATFDAAGHQSTEDVTDVTSQGDTTTSDHTVSRLDQNGAPSHRVETYEKHEQHVDPTTHESVDARQVTVGTWNNGGAPIGDDVVPALTFSERVEYTTPGAGINKDTDRHLVTERSAAGAPGHLTWNGPMHLTARFDGHGDQYDERRIDYPLDANGQPEMTHPTVVGDDNHESGLNKAVLQARIYGGFASSLLGMGGINLVTVGMLKGAGKGLLWAGAAVGALAVGAEASAFATKRNDAYWPNLAMNLYDTAWMGLYAYTRTFPPKGAAADAAAGAFNPARMIGDNAVAGAGLLGSTSAMRHQSGDGAVAADAAAILVRARHASGLDDGSAVPASSLSTWRPEAAASHPGPRLDASMLPA